MFSGGIVILFALAIGGNDGCMFDEVGILLPYKLTNGGEGLFGRFIPDIYGKDKVD
jgi:hypothetical protein